MLQNNLTSAATPSTASPEFIVNLDKTYIRLQGGLSKNKRNYKWRMEQLQALKNLLEENDQAISSALWKDLRKSKFECTATEQGVVLSELNLMLKKLKSWMKPKSVSTPLYNLPGRSLIMHEPYGLVLIIGAWNYPINLLLAPLVGAIAGGNGAIIKPSEISIHTASLLGQLIPQYMDPELFAVIEGSVPETSLLLDKKFDKIFFTGSSPVGKIILSKAAVHLTPTTLELGGKSPAVVWKDADLEVTARRLAWGKFMNAGQTCVAPDYVIVHADIYESFVEKLKLSLVKFYGHHPIESPDYCRIVNTKNFDRLVQLLDGHKIIHGGKSNKDQLYIEPTLIDAMTESKIMTDEIFGPLFPILKMDTVKDVIDYINSKPQPLALYLFSSDHSVTDLIIESTSSGGVCVNDCVIHLPEPTLPFGGVGASGMGNYHGKFSFDAFTHAKGILKKTFWFDAPFRYAPYTNQKAFWLKWLMK
ncbi:MAG: aldehyde dehydrogenase [Bdellovibrionaceae bacterium]|nr:aldehyde dehydrogenase [Pseudobdellovibrionaceae bacterium]